VIDDAGNTVTGTSPFAPQYGLVLLPLPVQPHEDFNSATTDPNSGQALVQRGTTGDRLVFDACGDAVAVWQVHAQQISAGTAGGAHQSTITYDYGIATQYGAMPFWERVTDAAGNETTTSLADLFPDPLPPGVK